MPKKVTEDTLIGDIIHQWEIPEYEKHDRGSTWIIVMSVVALALILFGIFTDNFLFPLVIILAGIIIFLQHHEEPIQVPFAITDLGIIIGNKFYPYKEIDAFFIIYEPPEVKKIFFETDSKIRPLLRVSIKEQNPVEIRHSLQEFIPEDLDKEEEPFTDEMARKLKIH